MSLQGKTVLVTGGTRGIGKGIALAFANAGAKVALFGMNEQRGKEVLAEFSGEARFYAVDVSDYESVTAGMNQVQEDLGPVEILINNAGIVKDNLLMRLSEEHWEAVIDTNLKSVYNTCKNVIRPMMKARFGRIINITSVSGLMGNAGQTNYAASKAGMVGFSKSLAKELATRGITVNCIAPGFIKSDMTDALTDKQKEGILSLIPMQRLGSPEDIAQTALFLASDFAGYITGQVLTVDGGMVM